MYVSYPRMRLHRLKRGRLDLETSGRALSFDKHWMAEMLLSSNLDPSWNSLLPALCFLRGLLVEIDTTQHHHKGGKLELGDALRWILAAEQKVREAKNEDCLQAFQNAGRDGTDVGEQKEKCTCVHQVAQGNTSKQDDCVSDAGARSLGWGNDLALPDVGAHGVDQLPGADDDSGRDALHAAVHCGVDLAVVR
mmetsp:Transcript_51494/g.122457  ORF Transcript_51494/g.122457 Transcript_51494/m.122457 type:complete len:193 (+) Transcript_51494:33-611(+)